MSNADTGFVRLPDGLRLRYRCMGDEGPTVLLLHGWPETGHAWRRVLPTLAASGYVAVAPDLRGCGDSDKPTGGYDPETRMEDVRGLTAALGLNDDPIFVAGQGDFAADITVAYASAYPSEIAGIAFMSAAPGLLPGLSGWAQEFHRTPDLPELMIGPILEAYLRYFFQTWAHDPQMLSDTDLSLYVSALASPGALRASLAPFRVPPALAMTLPPVPTLVLLGESDPRCDPDHLPESTETVRWQSISRGGYWLPEERPDPVAAALLTFFREQAAR